MNRRTTLFCILPLVALAITALAETEVIGTVQMSVEGDEQTWYVLDPGGNMLPTSLWLAMGPEHGALSIAAYESPDIEFVRDDMTGSAVPAGDAAVLIFSIGFTVGTNEQAYTLPLQPGDGPASVQLLTNWANPIGAYDMSLDPGRIHLTSIDASTDGPSAFEGTFNGVLRNDAHEAMSVENGRIDIERASFFAAQP